MSYLLILLFVIILLTWIWINNSEPKLPSNIDALVHEVMNESLPELIKGKTGKVDNNGISIFYEIMGNENAEETILLINGHTQTLLDWPPHFCEPLIEAGYQVIRYDNRGIAMSDWLEDWNAKTNNYSLEDMATDAIAILDFLKIKKAHIIGQSMGGMIGQRLAISHSKRVATLTSIMSTGFYYDPKLVNIPFNFLKNFISLNFRFKRSLNKVPTKMKFQLGIRKMLKGNGSYNLDNKAILQQAFYEVTKRNGFNSKAVDQHSHAIKFSGSRYNELNSIQAPTLVVHGTGDTLILFEHAQKYSTKIPNVNTLFIKGMGHDLPKIHTPVIIGNIFNIFDKSKVKQA